MDITDQFYSNQNEKDIQDRINALGKGGGPGTAENDFKLFQQFLVWRKGVIL